MNEFRNTGVRDLVRLGDLEEAKVIADVCLEECGDHGNSPDIWSLRLARADLLRLRGFTEEAVAYLTAMRAAYPPAQGDLVTLIGLKRATGYCLGLLGKYPASHKCMSDAERLAVGAGLTEPLAEVHQCQAMIYYLQSDYESSARIFRLILGNADRIGGWYFRANALWGIGKNLMIQGHHLEALPWLEESLSLFESAGSRLSMATVWGEMAVCYLGLGDDNRALEMLERSLRVEDEAGAARNYQVGLANIGNVYLHRGDYLRAIDYYRQALSLAREIKDPVSIQKWSHNIRLAYTRLRESVDGSVSGAA